MPAHGAAQVRRSARRSASRVVRRGRRVATAAADRYRTAVTEQSRWLPAYLVAVDVTGAVLRLRRSPPSPVISADAARSRGFGRDHRDAGPVVVRAALGGDGVLSFVLAGAYGWRHTIRGVALDRDGERRGLPDALLQSAADVIRVNVTLPGDGLAGAALVLLDAAGVALDLPTPDLAHLTRPTAQAVRG